MTLRVRIAIGILFLFGVVLMSAPLWASERYDIDAEAEANVATGDTNLGGDSSRAFGFSHSLGDVDINEGKNCMGSEQWGTIIVSKQDLVLNSWCAALFYELNGKHRFAAAMRCDIKEIGRHYGSVEACIEDQTLTPEEVIVSPELAGLYDQAAKFVDHDEKEDRHDEELVRLQMVQEELFDRIEQAEQAPAPGSYITEEQKTAIREVLNK